MRAVLALTAVLAVACVACADEVVLRSGGSIEGKVTKVTEKEVTIETEAGPVSISRKLVKEIRRSGSKTEPAPSPQPKPKPPPTKEVWAGPQTRSLGFIHPRLAGLELGDRSDAIRSALGEPAKTLGGRLTYLFGNQTVHLHVKRGIQTVATSRLVDLSRAATPKQAERSLGPPSHRELFRGRLVPRHGDRASGLLEWRPTEITDTYILKHHKLTLRFEGPDRAPRRADYNAPYTSWEGEGVRLVWAQVTWRPPNSLTRSEEKRLTFPPAQPIVVDWKRATVTQPRLHPNRYRFHLPQQVELRDGTLPAPHEKLRGDLFRVQAAKGERLAIGASSPPHLPTRGEFRVYAWDADGNFLAEACKHGFRVDLEGPGTFLIGFAVDEEARRYLFGKLPVSYSAEFYKFVEKK